LAGAHDRDPGGHLRHDRQAMRDEDVGKPEFLLQFPEQAQDLRWNRNIKGRDGFVRNDELRTEDQRALDSDALV